MILFKSNDESFTSKIEYNRYKTAFAITEAIKWASSNRLYLTLAFESLNARNVLFEGFYNLFKYWDTNQLNIS